MSNPVAVVTSDSHMEPHAWAKHPGLRGDSYFAFEQTVDYALMRGLPLLMAGDNFNKPYPDSMSVRFFCRQMDRMQKALHPVWYVQGQHCKADPPWPSVHPWPQHMHKKNVNLPNSLFNCYGLDFMPSAQLKDALEDLPAPECSPAVLVCHQVWEERMGQKAAPEAAFRDVPQVSCIITGDFHGHSVKKFIGKWGQTIVVASPGSQCMQTVDEDSSKFFFVMYADLTFDSIPLKSRKYERFTFRPSDRFEDELSYAVSLAVPTLGLPEELQKPVFVVDLSEEINDGRRRVELALGGRTHLMMRLIEAGKTEDEGEEEQRPTSASLGLMGKLKEKYDADPAVYSTTKRVLESTDQKAEIVAVIREVMEAPHSEADPWTVGPAVAGEGE